MSDWLDRTNQVAFMDVCRHFSLCSSRAPITLEFPILSESPSAKIEKPKIPFKIRRAHFDDLAGIQLLLKPFVEQRKLLRRMQAEILLLMSNGYVAEAIDPNGVAKIVGFAAVEIYSRKLGEIQSLAVADSYQGNGIGSALVKACVERAREKGIMEVMAISASEGFLRQLGFDYSLPEQKRALFYQLHSRDEIFKDERNE
jgi:amino-acid N-acetyltransferase